MKKKNEVFERIDPLNERLRSECEGRWEKEGVDKDEDVVQVGTLEWNVDILNEYADPLVHERTRHSTAANARGFYDEFGFALVLVKQTDVEEDAPRRRLRVLLARRVRGSQRQDKKGKQGHQMVRRTGRSCSGHWLVPSWTWPKS